MNDQDLEQDLEQDHRPPGWWSWPLIASAGLYVVAFLPGIPAMPWWGWPAVAAVAVLACRGIARHVFPYEYFGRDVHDEAGYLGAGSAVGGVAWLFVAYPAPPQSVTLLALWLAAAGSWWVVLNLRAPAAERAVTRRLAAGDVDDQPAASADGPYPAILARAGVRNVVVTKVETSPDGAVDTVHIEPTEPEEGAPVLTFPMFAAKAEAIAAAAARHFRSDGLRLEAGDVIPRPGIDAAEFQLSVTRRRNLDGNVPFVPDEGPQPWTRALDLGLYEDLRPMELTLCHAKRGATHLEILGKSESGKGVLLACLIARLTASDEGEVWLVGVSKLAKLAALWLEPWLRGETDRPVIDRVGGEDIGEALRALADALHFMKLCNEAELVTSARVPKRGKGGLVIVIDEAGRLLERTDWIKVYDGRKMTAGEIVAEIKAEGRTGPVSVVTANQDNLFDSSGAKGSGSRSKRNTGIAVVLNVKVAHDASGPLAGMPKTVDPTKLRANQCYVVPNTEEPRALRGKAAFIDDSDIPGVARRNTAHRYGLDPTLTAQLATYSTRWAADRHPVLVRHCKAKGWQWPGLPAASPAPSAPPREEPPMSNRPDDDLTDFWAACEQQFGDLEADDAPPTPRTRAGELPPPDLDAIRRIGDRLVNSLRAHAAANGREVPDPLGHVLALLTAPGAPTEWVRTAALAVRLGRVTDRMDAGEKRRAVEQFGRELSEQTGVRSRQLPRQHDPKQRRGYRIAELREAALRIIRDT